ncbi:hypothetical protein HBI80_039390 [Parastagonospora nodorum]|nr:hypothetical protein HBI09_087190 [Parastagonospora nodorum]KAH4909528.1 hypothetical protein HBI80_039390 [Parastagonospora nodorum]KAH6221881.1 hypothetical protein HBI43_090920 [Parastagonospora nodorum]KAH6416474.1 hypothetical protein HBI08_105880 [Parastagonospora nodorum]
MTEDDVPQGNTTSDAPEAVRTKRSRTGCLTCRTRRRKCDETRPTCQNCVAKGLECRYAALYQILGKNNYTPMVEGPARYASVQFVSDGDEVFNVANSGGMTDADRENGRPIAANSPIRNAALCQGPSLQDMTNFTPSPNSYQSALHGLLTLGSRATAGDHAVAMRHQTGPLSESTVHDFAVEPAFVDVDHDVDSMATNNMWHSESQFQVDACTTIPTERAELRVFGHIVPTTRASRELSIQNTLTTIIDTAYLEQPSRASLEDDMTLLKIYRYQIAPWLDIFDRDQSFGVQVAVLSTESETLRNDILSLARATRAEDRAAPVHMSYVDHADFGPRDYLRLAVSDVFSLLKHAMIDLEDFWDAEAEKQNGLKMLEALLPKIDELPSLAEHVYWLMVRLELSCVLMNATCIRLPLPFLAQGRLNLENGGSMTQRTQDGIALCVDAVMFSQGDDDRWLQKRYGLNRVDTWKALVQGFSAWFLKRPDELLPIIELYPKDGIQADNDFPIIAFTSGGALLANQLYHCGMLLLLRNKPRFVGELNRSSPSMSTLWHVHRICGIAIHNDSPATWDPCLVASLLVAAQIVTHRSQQTAIINALDKAQRLTGWNVSRHIEDLRNEWRLADGW